jgi:hypothetical protein
MAASTSSSAAIVQVQSGSASINNGQGFTRVSSGTYAAPGDSVMVGPNGSALLVYEDGCQQNIAPGAVVTISATSPCSGAGNGGGGQPGLVLGAMAVAGGVGGAVILSSDNDHHPASP